jgi:processive 1,2-diacylglycerol beta-glucosyltransferase
MKNILILTTGFGDGHHSAAHAIRDALHRTAPDYQPVVCDAICQAVPQGYAVVRAAYNLSIRYTPALYGAFYDISAHLPPTGNKPWFRSIRRELRRLLNEWQPAAIVSTYPLYTSLLRDLPHSAPLFTLLTDAGSIHRLWYHAPSDWYLAPDEPSAATLRANGVCESAIRVLGYPVSPRCFDEKNDIAQHDEFRLLFLPQTARDLHLVPLFLRFARVQLTVVLGRNDGLRPLALKYQQRAPHRVRVEGWRDDLPHLLASHHALATKAGGAITHEALSLGCVPLFFRVVPGQEIGNVEKTLAAEAGFWARNSDEATRALRILQHHDVWQQTSQRGQALAPADAALRIADFIAQQIRSL